MQLTQATERPAQEVLTQLGIIPEEFRPNNQTSFCSDAENTNCLLEIQISTSGSISYKRRQKGTFSFAAITYITN